MKTLFVVVILLAWFAAPARAADDTGVAAYKRGDYATAFRELKPLAEAGKAEAQAFLAEMYANG